AGAFAASRAGRGYAHAAASAATESATGTAKPRTGGRAGMMAVILVARGNSVLRSKRLGRQPRELIDAEMLIEPAGIGPHVDVRPVVAAVAFDIHVQPGRDVVDPVAGGARVEAAGVRGAVPGERPQLRLGRRPYAVDGARGEDELGAVPRHADAHVALRV